MQPKLGGRGNSLSFSKPKSHIPSQLPAPLAAQSPAVTTSHPAGPLSERPLMEVRLGELHSWISTCSFSPQGLLAAVQRGENSWLLGQVHPTSLIYSAGPSSQPGSLQSTSHGMMEGSGRDHKGDPVIHKDVPTVPAGSKVHPA